MKANINWSSPTRNWFKALKALTGALQSGYNARIIKMYNEDCAFPIRVTNPDNDFRKYEFNMGYGSTYNKILADNSSDFEKHLSLNYVTVYGSKESKEKYYTKGILSADNFRSMGCSHLVKVTDMIDYYNSVNTPESNARANSLVGQYLNPDNRDKSYFFDFYGRTDKIYTIPKKFKHKLFVIELLDKPKEEIKYPLSVRILIALQYPLKFIPKKSVLHMKEYRLVTYRVGDVINGFTIEFHIPKKFGFK